MEMTENKQPQSPFIYQQEAQTFFAQLPCMDQEPYTEWFRVVKNNHYNSKKKNL